MESQAEQQLRQTVPTVALQAASAISGKEKGLPAPDIHLQEVSSPRSARRVWRVQMLQHAETMVVEVKQHTQRRNAEWETSILRRETQPTGIYRIEGQVVSGLYRGAPRALALWHNRQKVGWADLAGSTQEKPPRTVYHLFDRGLRSLYHRRVKGIFLLDGTEFRLLPDVQAIVWEEV